MPRLRVIPINRIDGELLARLGHCLEERFLLEAVVENAVTISDTTLNRERDQLFFNTLVARVQATVPATDDMLLAITHYDLYKTSGRFVFGGAADDGRIAAVSLRRLLEPNDPNLMFQRLLKLSTHALGRAYGLTPCHDDRCAMSIASTVYEIDSGDSHFCEVCERKQRSKR